MDEHIAHTPGPWKVVRKTAYTGGEAPEPEEDYWNIDTEGGETVCTVWELWPEDEWTSQGTTNAQLIAGVGGLLEAAQHALDVLNETIHHFPADALHGWEKGVAMKLEAAIMNATGPADNG